MILNHDDGTVTFMCHFCGACVGPLKAPPKGVQGTVEMTHLPQCVFIEAAYLNKLLAVQRFDN